MSAKPKVSVLCLTYNQARYIRQTLDGFLMQKADFDFEIIINDDASTDGTIDLLKEYQSKHPEVIRLVLHKQNQFSEGKRNFFVRYLLPIAKGDYIALCEGDDYWTDPDKLQLQADFLDKHKDYSICFHPVRVFFENGEKPDSVFPATKNPSDFNVRKLLMANFIQTNSVMYRRQKYKNLATHVAPGDWYLHLYHAQFGKIGFIDKVMADYRRHPGGIWWNSDKDIDKIWKNHGVQHLALYTEMLNMYGYNPEYHKIIYKHISDMISNLIESDRKYKVSNLDKALAELNSYVKDFLTSQHGAIISRDHKIDELNQELNRRDNLIESKEQEIAMIKSSRVWKLRNRMAVLMGKRPI